jgi:hypothetical protein
MSMGLNSSSGGNPGRRFKEDVITTSHPKQGDMHFCENCGAIRGIPAIGCLAFFSRGPHSYVVGNKEMACIYCGNHPGGLGTRCSGRMRGGCHDFRPDITAPKEAHIAA